MCGEGGRHTRSKELQGSPMCPSIPVIRIGILVISNDQCKFTLNEEEYP